MSFLLLKSSLLDRRPLSVISLPPLSLPSWVVKIPKMLAVVYSTRPWGKLVLPLTPPEPALPKIIQPTCPIGSYNGTAQAEYHSPPLPFCPLFSEPLPDLVSASSSLAWAEPNTTSSTITSITQLPAAIARHFYPPLPSHEACVAPNGSSSIVPGGTSNGMVVAALFLGLIMGYVVGRVSERRLGKVAPTIAKAIVDEKAQGEITVVKVPAIVVVEAIRSSLAATALTAMDPASIPLPSAEDGELDEVDEQVVKVLVVNVQVIDPAAIPLPLSEDGELEEQADDDMDVAMDSEELDPATIPLSTALDDELEYLAVDTGTIAAKAYKLDEVIVEADIIIVDPTTIPLPLATDDELDEVIIELVEPTSVVVSAGKDVKLGVAVVEVAAGLAALTNPAFIPLPSPDTKTVVVDASEIDPATIPLPAPDNDELEALGVQAAAEDANGVALHALLVLIAAVVNAPVPTSNIAVAGPIDLRYIWRPRPIRPWCRNAVTSHPTRLPPVPDASEVPCSLRPFRRRGTLHRWLTVLPMVIEVEEIVKEPNLICAPPPRPPPPLESRSRMVGGARRNQVRRPRGSLALPAPRR